MPDNTQRFSSRVEDYILYRPHYPIEILDILKSEYHLTPQHTIADIGSGTGISSEIFLENGNQVYALEPNTEMRLAAESLNKDRQNFISRNGTGETTGLSDSSIDFIVCAQTFHWLDFEVAKNEFHRILKPAGKLILIWNDRSKESNFQKEYDATLLRCVSAYKDVTHRNISEDALSEFFAPRSMTRYQLPNFQEFDFEGLIGRMKSSSYVPKEGKEHDQLVQSMKCLFDQHQTNGKVRFDYVTKVYVG